MYKSNSVMSYLNSSKNPTKSKTKKEILMRYWKWFKIFMFLFIIVSMLWGCIQMYQNTYLVNKITTPIGTSEFAPGVSFEIIIKSFGGVGGKNNYVTFDKNGGLIEYGYLAITNWGEAFSKTGGSPFYGLFVYPTAFILVGWVRLFSNGLENPLSPGLNSHDQQIYGIAALFGILFTVIIVRGITLGFTWKTQKNQEKMQSLQIKQAEITAKYKDKKDAANRQKQQAEISALYKKEGLSQLSSFTGSFASMPFLFAIFAIIRSTRVLKIANIGAISLIEQPWSQITSGNLIYLTLLAVYLPLQIVSMLLPTLLQYTKKKNASLTPAQQKARKRQMLMQIVMIVVFIFIVASIASGVCIYWIFSSTFQISQTLGFHYYNSNKSQKQSREVTRRKNQEKRISAKTND